MKRPYIKPTLERRGSLPVITATDGGAVSGPAQPT